MVNGLYIGKNALLINQAALNVVSNNIANANTDGYSKQRVNLSSMSANMPVSNAYQQAKLGYGVELDSITRYRDSFIDSSYRESLSTMSYYETIASYGQSLENFANEFNDSGMSTSLNSFFSAANNLSLYPTDITMKTDFVQQASNMVLAINSLYTKLNDARTELVGDVNDPLTLQTSQLKFCTDEINQKLDELANLNEMVIFQHSATVGAPAGLLDQRDILLDEISQYIPIEVEETVNGGVNVSLGNVMLVGGAEAKGHFKINIGNEDNPAIVSFEDENGYVFSYDVKDTVGNSGKLGGLLTLAGNSDSEVTIKSMIDNLNKMTTELVNQFNKIQTKSEAGPPEMASAYYNPNTDQLEISYQAIFKSSDGKHPITAENLMLNSTILEKPYLVSTAYVEVDRDENGNRFIIEPDAIGNNTSAQAMVDLRLEKLAGLGHQTFEGFNTTITTDFGSKLGSANANYEATESIYNSMFEQRESSMGVNIEEELVDLVKFQRAYESSARIFTVSNEILQTLVNLGR